MDVEQLKSDVRSGKVSTETLLEIIVQLKETVQDLEAQLAGKNPTPRLDESYSQKAEERRKAKDKKKSKRKPLRRGRITTADKIKLAERTELAFPDGCAREECKLSHTRVAWRLENGRAVLVAYEIYRCGNRYGQPAGLHGRSEFGMEIVVALGYQVYCLGLSIDKACAVMSFFQKLELRKSQADALLNQLSRQWEEEFDHLCTLLAHSAIIHCDETSWSINSVWAFLNDKLTVLFYGVHKDGQTLAQIIDKEIFGGILISDNAAVYKDFKTSQKCWAHLIRKAIKLTLQAPTNASYRIFADGLLEVYRRAKAIASDGRLGDSGRQTRTDDLHEEVWKLCRQPWVTSTTAVDEVEADFRRLCSEIIQLMMVEELFTFVLHPEIDGNNNAAERQLRDDATARKTGRTSKTVKGAKRRSIISSVLQSVAKQLPKFTLEGVIEEIASWQQRGSSCFAKLIKSAGIRPPPNHTPDNSKLSLLDRVILTADQ